MTWTFHRTDPMGGATGEAFSNVLQGTGMASNAVMAREAIQNSVDAQISSDGDKVRMRFRHCSLTGDKKRNLIKVLDLQGEFSGRSEEINLQPDNCMRDLDDLSIPLHVLYIEDFGTHGLYGDPFSPDSHFNRLLLSLGDSSKAWSDKASGGSYGYGKAVYSSNSRIHTIVAHSVFEPHGESDGAYARLMGCAYFNSHKHDGQDFSGRAWFGIPSEDERVVSPYENESAQELATSLGFSSRGTANTGTSILIVDCPVNIDELRKSIEDWWWPRILVNELDVEIIENQQRVDPPRLKKRADLEPFIRCFNMTTGTTSVTGSHEKAESFRKKGNVHLGAYGLTVVDEDSKATEDMQSRIGTVALIRTPKMVVAYMPLGGQTLQCQGVLLASDEVDQSLRLSEPPAHDKWDPKSSRFHNEEQRGFVEAVLNRIKTAARKFAADATPAAPSDNVRMKFLERMLGSTFRVPSSPGNGPPDGRADPIQITFPETPSFSVDGSNRRTIGEFQIGLAPEAEKSEVLVSVQVRCVPVEDQAHSVLELIPVQVTPEAGSESDIDDSSESHLLVLLDQGSKHRFAFESDPYPSDWATKVDVFVQEAE